MNAPANRVVWCERHKRHHLAATGCMGCATARAADELADQLTIDRIRAHLERENREKLLAQVVTR